MAAVLTYAIICIVAIFIVALLWLLRDLFTPDSYERQTADGYYSHHQFTTIEDLPEKTGLGQLMVKCRKCGGLYPSGITGDFEIHKQYLERLGNVTTTCPFCKHQNRTSPRNMTYTVS
jgi:hypothetical protein